ncbi:hypothetical protein BaRGS_00031263 [Batillaria attramentaria]|uniref:Uncharacterized protein n=1 Tax=Batillaria attramentaria TaxID=370345 RepID=A0ABD0JR74_9CAEN
MCRLRAYFKNEVGAFKMRSFIRSEKKRIRFYWAMLCREINTSEYGISHQALPCSKRWPSLVSAIPQKGKSLWRHMVSSQTPADPVIAPWIQDSRAGA